MIQKQLIELIQQHHTDIGETELRFALNRAKDDFCAKTEIIVNSWVQTSTAGQRYYPLDSEVLRVKEVQINDVVIPRLIGRPIIDDDEYDAAVGLTAGSSTSNERYWFIENDKLGVVEKVSSAITRDGKQSDYQSISEAKEIRVIAVAKDTDFGESLSQTSAIPSQFQEALVFKVIADLMLRSGSTTFNPELSNLFEAKYMQLTKDAKKYARDGKIHAGAAVIRPTDF